MKFLYRTEDVKLINSVKPLPYLKEDTKILSEQMAEVFFRLKPNTDILGIVDADKNSVVGQTSTQVNIKSSDDFEFLRIEDWEQNYSKVYNESDWNKLLDTTPFADSVAKVFWLCDHLRNNGSIDFPITQAWNRYHKTWEVTVGNARIAPLRLFYKNDTLSVIRYKTEFCQEDIAWTKTFASLKEIEQHFGHAALINYRAWGGSLIPGIHFYNKNRYNVSKLEYQNKLATYFIKNAGLGIERERSLYYNINKILDGINVLA